MYFRYKIQNTLKYLKHAFEVPYTCISNTPQHCWIINCAACIFGRETLPLLAHSGLDYTVSTVASPAIGHWGTCPLDFQQFHF